MVYDAASYKATDVSAVASLIKGDQSKSTEKIGYNTYPARTVAGRRVNRLEDLTYLAEAIYQRYNMLDRRDWTNKNAIFSANDLPYKLDRYKTLRDELAAQFAEHDIVASGMGVGNLRRGFICRDDWRTLFPGTVSSPEYGPYTTTEQMLAMIYQLRKLDTIPEVESRVESFDEIDRLYRALGEYRTLFVPFREGSGSPYSYPRDIETEKCYQRTRTYDSAGNKTSEDIVEIDSSSSYATIRWNYLRREATTVEVYGKYYDNLRYKTKYPIGGTGDHYCINRVYITGQMFNGTDVSESWILGNGYGLEYVIGGFTYQSQMVARYGYGSLFAQAVARKMTEAKSNRTLQISTEPIGRIYGDHTCWPGIVT